MGPLRVLVHVYNRPQVAGRDVLAHLTPPVLFAANHASHLDTPVILQSLPGRWRRRTSVVAAMDYFFKRRSTGFAVALAFATVPIERKNLSRATHEHVDRLVGAGWSLLMYPEGTRTRTGKLGALKPGAARLALRYGIPIVPICLTGTHESHPKGSDWPTSYPVEVRFGAPLTPRDDDPRALTSRLREALVRLAEETGRPDP